MIRPFTSWLLPRYAAGSLPGPLRHLVQRALDRDIELAAQYDAMRRAERVMAGGAGLSAGQLDLLLAGVLEQTDAATAASARQAGGGRAWMPASLAAAAAVAFVVTGTSPSTSTTEHRGLGELTARSALMASAPLGMRVRCVVNDRVVGDATAGARQTGADLDCGQDGLLAFSTTNLATSPRHAFVVGVNDDSGERVWLAPFPRGSSARVMAPGVADELVDVLTPMASLPANVTLHLLLSDEPFTSADVENRLSAAERAAVPLKNLERLPVDVPVQARLTVHRAP